MRVQPERESGGFFTRLLAPSEPPLPAGSAARSIKIDYRPRELRLVRWLFPWYWSWFAVMSVAILMLRRPMRVAI